MLKNGVSRKTASSIVMIKNNLEMISMLLHARDFCPPWITSYCWNGLTEDISQWFLSKLAVYLETTLYFLEYWFGSRNIN